MLETEIKNLNSSIIDMTAAIKEFLAAAPTSAPVAEAPAAAPAAAGKKTVARKGAAKKAIVPITEDQVPEGHVLCIACEGTKVQSKGGGKCPVCKGLGFVEAEAEEEEDDLIGDDEEGGESWTLPELKEMIKTLVNGGESTKVKALFKQYGASKVSEIPEESYAEAGNDLADLVNNLEG